MLDWFGHTCLLAPTSVIRPPSHYQLADVELLEVRLDDHDRAGSTQTDDLLLAPRPSTPSLSPSQRTLESPGITALTARLCGHRPTPECTDMRELASGLLHPLLH